MRWRAVLLVIGAMVVGGMVATGIGSALRDREDRADKVGVLTRMEHSGEMEEILEKHRVMLQQMESNASPQMLELMNNDPMWQMMRSERWARLEEQHKADIDRMLGKGQP